MKTDDWIAMLATGAEPVPAHALERHLGTALMAGVAGAGVLMLLVFGLRPELAQMAALPMFWGKLGFAAALALPAGWALLQSPEADRWGQVLGSTWRSCPLNIALLSVPMWIACFGVLRRAAPTRLAWAGAGAGLLAGAVGALVYAVHCPEMALPFVAVWYVAGMMIPTLLGALLGPRLLRW